MGVHYIRDVTQAEDKSRIRTTPPVQTFALVRKFALNLHRDYGVTNMAQTQCKCAQILKTLKVIFE
ncbi:MAG: hypothetical protein AAF974_08365 [Cyanobacteria bacterium P01_E01_bin.34]